MTGYEKIKQLAKKNHCNIADLLVLAKQNDPFLWEVKRAKLWRYGLPIYGKNLAIPLGSFTTFSLPVIVFRKTY